MQSFLSKPLVRQALTNDTSLLPPSFHVKGSHATASCHGAELPRALVVLSLGLVLGKYQCLSALMTAYTSWRLHLSAESLPFGTNSGNKCGSQAHMMFISAFEVFRF